MNKTYGYSKIIKFLCGLLLFFLVLMIDFKTLSSEGAAVLALYAWIVAWWIAKPLPWSITSLLPLLVIPITGMMKLSALTPLYGQPILFFLIGVLSLGTAVSKHGLGRRLALTFLAGKRNSGSTYGILLRYLVMVMLISSCVDDAATIAICLPIGISIVDYVRELQLKTGKEANTKKLQTFMVLGVLYAAEAGGIMSIAGIPHIPVAISILEKTTGISVSFLEWSRIGIPMGIASFVLYFLILRLMCKPEILKIENAAEFFGKEKQLLGKLTLAEKNTIAVFFCMILLWVLPNFVKISFLNVWFVPVVAAVLLYLLPDGKGGAVLAAEDFQRGLPWDTIFLILGGGVMASLTSEFGVISWIQSLLPTKLSILPLMFLASAATAGLSNLISGTATVNIMANIFFPIVAQAGLNPITFAFLLPSSGMAIMFPWAGAATGTAFSSGKLEIREMIKCGAVATLLHVSLMVAVVKVMTALIY